MVLPYEPKKTSVASTPTSSRQHITDSQVQLARYEVDRRSAYFGNLPLDMTEEELQEMAIACGQVLNITLTRKPIPHGLGEIVSHLFPT